MNKVILMGRLTRDPNVRYTQQNSSQESMCVARYTLAVDRRGARDGQQSADFISCVAFGKNGEFAEKYFKQGTKIAITGRIQTGSYTNRDGQKMISNCGHDENNRYSGGKAGDQTGTEWRVINWYNRPWKCVLRHPDAKVRKMIASMAKAAAVNNKIGYDQSERYTFWEHLKASNYDPAQITIACEADCSSGVAAIVKGAGYRLGNEKMKNVSIYLYTGNMRAGLKAAGFEVLTDSKYLTSDAYLLEGDILLNDNAHVATNLTDGAKSSGTGASNTTTVKSNAKVDVAHGFNKSLAGTYKVTASGLNLRAGAGTGKSILAVMKNGEKVQCYGYYNDCNGVKWLYVVYKNIVGYASSKYLSK